MKKFLLLIVCMVFSAGHLRAQKEKLYGTWRLVSSVSTDVATGKKTDTYGPKPVGFITYGPEGRMQAILGWANRPKPSQSVADMPDKELRELMSTITAYTGTYDFDGKTVVHHVDLAANGVWTGTDLIRDVTIDGATGRATFVTRPARNPRDGIVGTTTLVWEKMK